MRRRKIPRPPGSSLNFHPDAKVEITTEFGRFLYDEALSAFSYTHKALNAVNSTWTPE
ncbi:MAG: hypothetical protein LC751_12920 [Actinobacteria bacterium]|nr:hypothetical protein [Actinomycetota bacterium]MCA1738427.1 hypothetical protein [Actinomycetota bacterium]